MFSFIASPSLEGSQFSLTGATVVLGLFCLRLAGKPRCSTDRL